MDSVTQAALGAGIAGALMGPRYGRKAILAGAALATLPDLDILIKYGDPLSQMINHRGFSHSLFVLTAFALFLGWLAKRFRLHKDGQGYGRLLLTIWLILITHPVLDAFTSYGTQLWWPLRPTPSSWSSVFIIDPFYTAPLLGGVLIALLVGPRAAMSRALGAILLLGAGYLGASLAAKHWAENRVHDMLVEQGRQPVAMFSVPQPFNIVLWRVVARMEDGNYVEAITGMLDNRQPEFIEFPSNAELGLALQPQKYIDGLRWFTGDWLRYDDIDGQLVVSDLRMGIGTGHYSFRFLIGERDPDSGQWQAVTPAHWQGGPASRDMAALKTTLARIWQTGSPLPLAAWNVRMTMP
ncbi:metal-dependent hydrolase [Achromobacter sp. F4_2707]|uniref:metal-dependent hydrolase n=1 Tax=Achromobacter sp. F4_2707 TaxID=3114286 RepID=UPI0039C5F40F